MNRYCWNSRSSLIPSLLLLLLLPVSSRLAAEVSLREFTASYDLYRDGMHLAISEMSLQQEGLLWHWRTRTTPRGIYAWFINNEPYSETTFTQENAEIRIQQISHKDPVDRKKDETASFEWDEGFIQVLRKGKQKQLPLTSTIYDYHSINLLAASMHLRQLDKETVDFYRKGKVSISHLTYGGTEYIDVDGDTVPASTYVQVIAKSRSQLKYFYTAASPLLPVRVEKTKHGEITLTLTLSKVDWNS